MPTTSELLSLHPFFAWAGNVLILTLLAIVGWVIRSMIADVKELSERVHRNEVSIAALQPPQWLLRRIDKMEEEIISLRSKIDQQ